jgi:hypothetical protein
MILETKTSNALKGRKQEKETVIGLYDEKKQVKVAMADKIQRLLYTLNKLDEQKRQAREQYKRS